MSPTSSARERPNNRRFSQCSQRDINNVFRRIERGSKRNCFATQRARLSDKLLTDSDAQAGAFGASEEISSASSSPVVAVSAFTMVLMVTLSKLI